MYAISTNFVSPQYSYLQTCNIFSTDFKPSTTNEFTVKDYFHFAEEIVDQQHDLFMGSLDVDSLFTNKPLEETIEICINELFKESETVEGLCKTECKEVFYLATEDSHLIFDGMAMGYTLGTILANASLVYHEKNWLEHCLLEYRPLCYRRYVDICFI